LLPTVSGDEVNGDLAGSLSVFMPLSLAFHYSEQEGYTYTPLMTTSDQAFIKSFESTESAVETVNGQQVLDKVEKEEGDVAGPFTLGLNVTADNGSSIYLYGSAYTFTESADDIVSGRNGRLFGQLMTTICSNGEDKSVVVPVKSFDAPTLTVTDYAIHMYGMLWGILLPLASIVCGVVIWILRRRK
jgi:ABC-2 type transport system permease protein